jgi:hypothetical protein
VALALLSLVGRSLGQPVVEAGECCVCNCAGVVSCALEFSPEGCFAFCSSKHPINGTKCSVDFLNSSCAAVPECPLERPAPALGDAALTAMSLFLAAIGIFGLRRAASRKRA